jgi:hypothetical protein
MIFDRTLGKIRQLRIGKSRAPKQQSLQSVRLYEYVARGWDVTTEKWRRVEWPPIWNKGYLSLAWCSDSPALPDNDDARPEQTASFGTAAEEEDDSEEGVIELVTDCTPPPV